MNKTLDYYARNARSFAVSTQQADMSFCQEKFCALLKPGGRILDFGCGSGRDSRAFMDKGFEVTAVDGCRELCAAASDFLGIPVLQMYFDQLDLPDTFDGVWACASLLHLPLDSLKDVLEKVAASLHAGGVFYCSFKYGTFSGFRNERYFTDQTEDSFQELLLQIPALSLVEFWISGDVRPGREEEKWLNILMTKR